MTSKPDSFNNWTTASIFGAVVILIFVAFQVGCNREPSEAEKEGRFIDHQQREFSKRLKDPSSAQFRATFVARSSGSPVVCGEVNSKTGFGGYAGFQRFVSAGSVQAIESEMAADEMDVLWSKVCGK
jgi:hypothetical protein